MKLTGRHVSSKSLSLSLVTILGFTLLLTSGVTWGHPEDEVSLHHHHQHQHRKQHSSRSMETHAHRRRRRHQKDHHQHQHMEGILCPTVAGYFGNRAEDLRKVTGGSLEILEESIPASHESVCYNERNGLKTCCRLEDEWKLEQLSMSELQQLVNAEVDGFKVKVQKVVTSYKEHVIRLLENLASRMTQVLEIEFHLPSKHVNSTVADLVDHLHVYLDDGNVDLSKIVEHFLDSTFALSYYHILHEPATESSIPDAEHSSCVLSVKNNFPGRSFTTAKFRSSLSFIKTLRSMIVSTGEVAALANNMDLDETCSRHLAKMNYCSKCTGTLRTPPCHWFCANVYTGCLANFMDLDFHWRDFIQVLNQLTTTTKNHVVVVESFPKKLEETLIHYQLEAELMHAMVSNQCGGHNDSNWRKRNFDAVREAGRLKILKLNSSEPIVPEFNPDQGTHENIEGLNGQTLSGEFSFMTEMEKSVKQLEMLWPFQNIVDDVCHKMAPQDKSSDSQVHCWNGTAVGEYSKISYRNSEFDNHDSFTSKSSNAAFISERLENNSMIIFKKTMGTTLPFRPFESFGGSGDDYEDYMSGSGGFWDGEFSGDFYEDDNDTTTETITHPSDFDFTDSTVPPSSSSSSSPSSTRSPSTSPTTKPKSTTLPGRPSGATATLTSQSSVLLLTSLVAAFTLIGNSCWILLRFLTSAVDWGCAKWKAVFLNVVVLTSSFHKFCIRLGRSRSVIFATVESRTN